MKRASLGSCGVQRSAIRWLAGLIQVASALVLLLVPFVRAAESGSYGACDDEVPCRYFKTDAEVNQYVEASHAERMAVRHKALKSLPVDERDCDMPVLVDLMASSGALKEKGAQRYATLGEADIDASRRERLATRGIQVLPGSARERKNGVTKLLNSTHHTKYWHFSVMLMAEGSSLGTFEVEAGYHCGTLCLGRLRYTVKVTGEGCEIMSKQLLSVS